MNTILLDAMSLAQSGADKARAELLLGLMFISETKPKIAQMLRDILPDGTEIRLRGYASEGAIVIEVDKYVTPDELIAIGEKLVELGFRQYESMTGDDSFVIKIRKQVRRP